MLQIHTVYHIKEKTYYETQMTDWRTLVQSVMVLKMGKYISLIDKRKMNLSQMLTKTLLGKKRINITKF